MPCRKKYIYILTNLFVTVVEGDALYNATLYLGPVVAMGLQHTRISACFGIQARA